MKNNGNEIVLKIGSQIRDLRIKLGLSQFKFAIQVGISENQLSRIERGESNPTIKTLCKIADALEVEITFFFMAI